MEPAAFERTQGCVTTRPPTRPKLSQSRERGASGADAPAELTDVRLRYAQE